MSRILKLGKVAPTISTRYAAFFPCLQAAPDSLVTLIDRSGKGNHALAGGSGIGAAAWSTTANAFSASNSTTTGAYLPKSAASSWVWTPTQRDTVVWSAQIFSPYAGASDTIFRTGTGSVTGGWWFETGATFGSGSTPGVKLKFYDTVTGVQDVVGNANVTASTWQTLTVIIDGPGNQAYVFVNGILAPVTASTNPRPLSNVNIMTVQAAAVDPYIMSSPTGHSETSYTKKIRGMHYAIVPASAGAIPDCYALAMRLHRFPFTPLAASELP